MKCAIHQPQFLPWLGYLHKIGQSDAFVFLDNVQYKKNEYQNRNRIFVGGAVKWLTVPVRFSFGETLRQARVADDVPWRKKMWGTIVQAYGKAPFFEPYAAGLQALVERSWDSLAAVNEATVRWLLDCFDIRPRLLVGSGWADLEDEPTGRLIDICRRVGADTYVSGAGGHDYLRAEAFADAGLRLEFQAFAHPVYPQNFRKDDAPFVPCLSAIDGLFNCGGGVEGRRRLGLG